MPSPFDERITLTSAGVSPDEFEQEIARQEREAGRFGMVSLVIAIPVGWMLLWLLLSGLHWLWDHPLF